MTVLFNQLDYLIYFSCLFRVDYVDSFGRTRRCLKKDLPNFQKQDDELSKPAESTASASTYGNFVKANASTNDQELQGILGMDDEARRRQRQIWEEEEERNRHKSKLHYQDVLSQGNSNTYYIIFY